MSPGLTTVIGGRPKPSPLLKFFSYLAPKESTQIEIELSTGHQETYTEPKPVSSPRANGEDAKVGNESVTPGSSSISGEFAYRLSELAFLRSGDKGDTCNIGVVARTPEIYPVLKAHLTAASVEAYFHHKFSGNEKGTLCQRYELPGVYGLNFVLKNSLGGGGIASLNPDPQGKGYAQQLADFTIQNIPKLV